MTEKPIGLTLEQIKAQFPPKWEVFNRDSEDEKIKPVEARVSRNQAGMIVYVVPRSIKKPTNRWFPGLSEDHGQQLQKIFGSEKEQ